jgi:methyl-accepting chemotaxis protein
LADQAGDALREIVTDAERTVDMVQQIATANGQQAASTQQIAQSIQMIAAVSNESSQGIELIAQSAQDLDGLIQKLSRLVGRFKNGDNEHIEAASVKDADGVA